jgi:hypothetical protein
MSASSCSSPDESGQLLLRWSDDPDLPSHEEFVYMLEAKTAELVLRSSFRVLEKTRVYLIGKDYSEAGIVRSCHKQGPNFILTIGISPEGPVPPHIEIDPSVFIIDSFLTEEQEERILSELEDELHWHDDGASSFLTASVQDSATGKPDEALRRVVEATGTEATVGAGGCVPARPLLEKLRHVTAPRPPAVKTHSVSAHTATGPSKSLPPHSM